MACWDQLEAESRWQEAVQLLIQDVTGGIELASLTPNQLGSLCSPQYAADKIGFPFSNPSPLRSEGVLGPPFKRHHPNPASRIGVMADRVGFEPTVLLPAHTLSKRAHSTTLTPVLGERDARRLAGLRQSFFQTACADTQLAQNPNNR